MLESWPPLNYYTYACLFNFIITGVFTFYVISKKPELKLARLFCIFSAGVAIWSLFYFISLKTSDRTLSEFCFRTCMVPVAFIPSAFFQFVTELTERRVPPWVHKLNYAISAVTVLTIYTDLFAIGGAPQHLVFPYWPKPGPIFPLHVFHFVGIVFIAHMVLLRAIHESSGLRRSQIQMVFWGMLIGFISGIMNYFTWYKLPIPPVLLPLVSTLVFAMGYAIVRHQLMDIRVVLRRSLVYSALVACITATYLVMVLVMERWFAGFMGYRSVVATMVVAFSIALGFNPLRERLQRLVDRQLFSATPAELAEQREQLLEEIRKSDQMKAVGTLAAGLAHEIKNPLASIKTFTEYLETKYDDPEFRAKFRKIVGGEVERMNLIVHQLLEFAKPVPPKLEPLAVTDVIDETLLLLGNELTERQVAVQRRYAPAARILGDRQQLKQVFLNLFLNSFQAMNGHGRLDIETAVEGANLRVILRDNGSGIAPNDLAHIFEPFFSTKEHGTGLGLAVVHGIIKEHGGRIEVNSQFSHGTTMTIHLPIAV